MADADRKSIKDRFAAMHAKRAELLTNCRRYSALTDPTLLPATDLKEGDPLRTAHQSLGSAGVENLVGKMLIAMFPPGLPWYRFSPSVEARTQLTPERLGEWDDKLYGRELAVQAKLEGTNYREKYRKMVAYLLVVGNGLMHLDDQYRFRTFRLDQYVLRRDGNGDVWQIIVAESKRVDALSDEQLARFNVSRDTLNKAAADGMVELHTLAERNRDATWSIVQELAGAHQSAPSIEPVSPYLSAGYAEVDGEDYARSFIEMRIGDLRSLNGISGAITAATVAAARLVPVFDAEKGWRARDLLQPDGKPVQGRVNGGQVDGLAFLQSNKAQDLQVAMAFHDRLENRLAQAMLHESAAIRDGERVTAEEVRGVRQELNGALGGLYAKIAAEIQNPLIERVVYMMERDRLIETFDAAGKRGVTIQAVTGVAALGREAELDRLLRGVQYLSQMCEPALAMLNMDTVALRILKLLTIDTTNIVKTPEQLRAEFEQRARQQMQVEAGSQAIQTIGSLLEQRAANTNAA